jgi:hypothetical protein
MSGIKVTGTGSVSGAPDIASIVVGASVLAGSVADARSRAASAVQAIVEAVKARGVPPSDVQTRRFTVQAEYDYQDNAQRLRGFRVSQSLAVKVRALDTTGAVLDAAMAAGGDDARVESMTFGLDAPGELERKARIAAFADARDKAATLAEAAGVTLGRATEIDETLDRPILPVPRARAMMADAAESTPIESGSLDVMVSLTVTFETS